MVTVLTMKGGHDIFSKLRQENISAVPMCLTFQYSVFGEIIFKLLYVFCDVL